MKLFKIAHRNLWRNKRRSIITLSAISIGLAALIFVWGFVDGMNEQTIENSTTYLTGHIKVHKKGFHDEKALHLAAPYDSALQARIAEADNVVSVTPRIEDKAMISGNAEARGTQVIGIDPEIEPRVTTIFKAITQGRYLRAGDENSLIIGDKLAERTGLNVGDEAVLVSQARDGSMAADRFEVVGIFDSGIDMLDGSNIFIPIKAAQEFYSLWGQVTAWVLRIDERHQAGAVKQNIENILGEGYEVLDWKQLMPEMVEMIRFHEVISYVVLFIVAVVVTVGVANTILMAVMERTREFGIMLALGTSQLQVIQIVLMEAVVLGVIGLVIGNLIGIAITQYYATAGIDLTQFTLAMETMPGLSGSIFPLLRFDHLVIVSVVVFAISVLPAFYPAWRVSRLQPVEAMRGSVRHRGDTKGTSTVTTTSSSSAIFWRIAFRSIRRNLRRSVLTAGATAFGLAAFLFLYAFTDGFFEQMIDNSIDFSVAHVQVEPEGYDNELSPKYFISDSDRVIPELKQNPLICLL
ncbi:MAG: ABC transporter permease [Gammaproteobacteria bacterium]|nr:ABC transporter permease [Gammaproteobacteria bacterium]